VARGGHDYNIFGWRRAGCRALRNADASPPLRVSPHVQPGTIVKTYDLLAEVHPDARITIWEKFIMLGGCSSCSGRGRGVKRPYALRKLWLGES
jgi:hypothetical protein